MAFFNKSLEPEERSVVKFVERRRVGDEI